MSKGSGWIPIDKNLAQEFKFINRPFSRIEAMYSFTLDIDNNKEWSINGYKKLWGWSRNKVRKFINEIRTLNGHSGDTSKTGYGHPIHFIDKGLWGASDNQRTPTGQTGDTREEPTNNPNHNPNPISKRERGAIPPEFEKVDQYFREKESHSHEAEKFYDHFQSNGWKVGGKAPMKDWRAAARNWIKRDRDNNKVYKSKTDINNEIQGVGNAIRQQTGFNPYAILEAGDGGDHVDQACLPLPK